MKLGLINRLKRLNWVSLVQGFWVFLALIISIGQTRAQGMNDPTKPPEAVVDLMPTLWL